MSSSHRQPRFGRRGFVLGAAGVAAAAATPSLAQMVLDIGAMQPGEYTWHPEFSPAGGVAIVVSLPEQRVHIYRNGVRIAVSTCSTGKEGHETPTGVFTVLQKDKNHHSSTYNNAPMPNMNRLTWDGVALHAGKLPGYPASHGCVRLPMEFSELLFSVTHIGTPVIISGAHDDPWELTHPGRLLSGTADGEMEAAVAALDGKDHPSDWPEGTSAPVATLLASSAERTVYLFEDGREVGTTAFDVLGDGPLGEHVLMLDQKEGQLYWVGITHRADPTRPDSPEGSVINRIKVPESFNALLRPALHPGMTLIVSDLPSRPDTRSGSDFVIMNG